MTETTFRLASTAFQEGGEIPSRFTCDDEDVSPDLTWEGAPPDTGALALIVYDPDASGWVHWVVFDMTGTSSGGLGEGIATSPDAPPQGTNSFGRLGWGGPCPPSGEHRYRFTLTALAAPLELEGAPRIGDLQRALVGASVLGSAMLEGTYRRG